MRNYADRYYEIPVESLRLGGTHAYVPGYDRLLPVSWRKPGSASPFSKGVWCAGGMNGRLEEGYRPHIDGKQYPNRNIVSPV